MDGVLQEDGEMYRHVRRERLRAWRMCRRSLVEEASRVDEGTYRRVLWRIEEACCRQEQGLPGLQVDRRTWQLETAGAIGGGDLSDGLGGRFMLSDQELCMARRDRPTMSDVGQRSTGHGEKLVTRRRTSKTSTPAQLVTEMRQLEEELVLLNG